MSNQEHYFENLLFAYTRGTYDECHRFDSNIKWLTDEEKAAIETCATYIIDCCNWDKDVVKAFLEGDFTISEK